MVVVAIDQNTFDKTKQQWPFPRRMHADLIDALRRAKAKAIAYDVQFTEPTDVADDNALIEAVARAGNVVLVTDAADANGETRILGGGGILDEIHATAGSSLFDDDADGRIRRMPYEQSRLKTLAVATVERATRRDVSARDFPGGHAWIDYAGPNGTVRTVLVRGRARGTRAGEHVRGQDRRRRGDPKTR